MPPTDKTELKDYLDLYFLLDEFGNTFIPNFPSYLTTMRKRNTGALILLQNLDQLAIYGKQGQNTIKGNCRNRLYFAGMDTSDLKELEISLGKTTIQVEKPDGSVNQQVRPLLEVAEIRTMGRDTALFVQANTYPCFLELQPYYKRRRSRKLIQYPPPMRYTGRTGSVDLIPIPQKLDSDSDSVVSLPQPKF